MGRRRIGAPAPTEKSIQTAVCDHWKLLGDVATSIVAAIPNQNAHGQPGLTPGLPDLLVLGEGVPGGVGFVELKRDSRSPLSEAQTDFRDLCNHLGVTWRVAVGRDEPIGLLEAWGVVRMRASSVVGSERAADLGRGNARDTRRAG
jgi:hypothetical protein